MSQKTLEFCEKSVENARIFVKNEPKIQMNIYSV